MKTSKIMWICESAIMIAAATVLSMIPVVKMPFGGSVTACSMVPVILIAYRYGIGKGLFAGLVYSILQLLLDLGTLSYATSKAAVVAIIFLDYIIAFTVIGFAGMFRKSVKNQALSISLGALVVCVLRFICHVISGCTVWAGVSIPSADGMAYSLAYNSAYMVPETIVTIAGVWYLAHLIDFKNPRLGRVTKTENESTVNTACTAVAVLAVLAAVVFDALKLFASMQTEDGFDITSISKAPFGLISIVSAVAVIIAAVSYFIGKAARNKALKN